MAAAFLVAVVAAALAVAAAAAAVAWAGAVLLGLAALVSGFSVGPTLVPAVLAALVAARGGHGRPSLIGPVAGNV
jgi:hypothetical protein